MFWAIILPTLGAQVVLEFKAHPAIARVQGFQGLEFSPHFDSTEPPTEENGQGLINQQPIRARGTMSRRGRCQNRPARTRVCAAMAVPLNQVGVLRNANVLYSKKGVLWYYQVVNWLSPT